MLAKLMSRKKSYERMMRNGENPSIPDLNSGKKQVGDMSMLANRASGLSRAQANSSTRKQI